MFELAWRALSRACGVAVVCAYLAACGGGDAQPSSGTSSVTVTGVDGASVRFRKLSGTAAPTVRVARNGSGAPQLPAQVQPVGGIYEFTPLGQFAAGIELRVPFERSALAAGQRPRLLVAAPGEPWTEVVGARVDGAAMVGRVPRLSHAVVAVGVGDRQSAPPATKLLRLMSPDAPPEPLTLAIDHGMTQPRLCLQPTRMASLGSHSPRVWR